MRNIGFISFFATSSLTLLLFQNCTDTQFQPIDYASKVQTMSEHPGLDGEGSTKDNGFTNNGGSSVDGGFGGNTGSTTDGGFGGTNGSNTDGGFGGSNGQTPDGGFGGSMGQTPDGGFGNSFGGNNFDGSFGGMGQTPDGGFGGSMGQTPDGGFGGSMGQTPDGGFGGSMGQNPDGSFGGNMGQNPDGSFGGNMGQNPDGSFGGNMGQNPDGSFGGNSGQNPDGSFGGNSGQNPDGSFGGNSGQNPDGSFGGNSGQNPDGGFKTGSDPVTNPGMGRFNVLRWCRGAKSDSSLKEATSVNIRILDRRSNTTVCEGSGSDLLDEIMNSHSLTIPNCNFSAVPNKYLVALVTDQNGVSLSNTGENGSVHNAFDQDKVDDEGQGSNARTIVGLHLLYKDDVDGIRESMQNTDPNCDVYNQSPLVVDMRKNFELKHIFKLSHPENGVKFNIEGERATPVADTKKKISWMKDPRIMPIVLPKNGQVFGINELFGNNTLGPDNKFSDNGFAALAKYDKSGPDGKPDGYITEDDKVYSKLRLWYDRNLNGESENGELYTLSQAGVTIIDLSYDPRFRSQDSYGNLIKYKSVVKLKSGGLKPVFDIWFGVNKRIQD